jgi:hypothetical protein
MGQRYDSPFRDSLLRHFVIRHFVIFKKVRYQQSNDEWQNDDESRSNAMTTNDEMATLPEGRFGETPNCRIFTARITFIFRLFFGKTCRFSNFFLHMGSV